MLRRKILSDLLQWKRTDHKSLIITGQRQIGKTYIIDEVFSKEYKSYIRFNFVKEPRAKEVFSGNLDIDTLISNISFEKPDSVFLPGNTLIFLDEIQDCPSALESLKFWTEDKRYDVIAAGSALSLSYSETMTGISYPVGNVTTLQMHSLDFEEFLWAIGIQPSSIDALRNSFDTLSKVSPTIDNRMWEYLRLYMVIGGMPAAVNSYIANHNIADVHNTLLSLLDDYRNHIAIYANPDIRIKAQKCYDSIPIQLGKDNHKFQYSIVEQKSTATKFGSSIDWLVQQHLVMKVTGLKRIAYPFESFTDDSNFRIYPTDIGMLIAMYDISLKTTLVSDNTLESPATGLILGTAKGGLFEALAADILYKNGYNKLFFYKHEKNTSEIEFLIIRSDSICPIEIKAGRKKANSLTNILENNSSIKVGYKMASKNIGQSGKMITLPLYMLMFL